MEVRRYIRRRTHRCWQPLLCDVTFAYAIVYSWINISHDIFVVDMTRRIRYANFFKYFAKISIILWSMREAGVSFGINWCYWSWTLIILWACVRIKTMWVRDIYVRLKHIIKLGEWWFTVPFLLNINSDALSVQNDLYVGCSR